MRTYSPFYAWLACAVSLMTVTAAKFNQKPPLSLITGKRWPISAADLKQSGAESVGKGFFFFLDWIICGQCQAKWSIWADWLKSNTGTHIKMIRTLQAVKHMDSISFHFITFLSCNSRISTLSRMASVLMLLYFILSFYFNLCSVSSNQNCVWWVQCIIHCFMSNNQLHKQLFPVRLDSSYKYCLRTKQTLYLNHSNWPNVTASVSEESINPDV